MTAIHFVERLENVHPVIKDKNEWESGYWVVGEDTANRLIGGHIFLHRGQDVPSHFGGTILSYRIQQGGPEDGRLVFRFRAEMNCKGVKAGKDGWGNEKKVEW